MSSGKLETLSKGGQGVKVSEGAVRWVAVGLPSRMTQLQRRDWRVDTVDYTLALAMGTCHLPWSCCLLHSLVMSDPLKPLWTVAHQARISQTRVLEWVAISYTKGSSPPKD